jgi:hypothetical protein
MGIHNESSGGVFGDLKWGSSCFVQQPKKACDFLKTEKNLLPQRRKSWDLPHHLKSIFFFNRSRRHL